MEKEKNINESYLQQHYFDEDQSREHATPEERKAALKILKNSGCYLTDYFLKLIKENKAIFYKGYKTTDNLHNVIYCYSLIEEDHSVKSLNIDIIGGYLC